MFFQNTSEEYSERAEECRQEARRSLSKTDAAAWLSLAEEWLRLARAAMSELTPEVPLEMAPKREAA
jgi:hypothetical protein